MQPETLLARRSRPSCLRRMAALFTLIACLCPVAAIGLAAGPVENAVAARYTVAQCGWRVAHDANWLETATSKFVRSSWCGVQPGSQPWDGVHLTSSTRRSATAIGGSKFARWRWQAPAGTGIVTVQGDRWHVLRNNFQHRIGSALPGRPFVPFAEHKSTNTDRRNFSRAFSPHAAAFESRLLCARPSGRFCAITGTSLAGLRGLTITINDPSPPRATLNGAFRSGGWLRGTQQVSFTGSDIGSGLRHSETLIDGVLSGWTEHPCNKALIAGQWRATKMRPCGTGAGGTHSIQTSKLSDGPHEIVHCAIDFAYNRGCVAKAKLRTDNTAPSAPRGLVVIGGDGWRRGNSFALAWSNPGQGVAAPLTGSRYRLTGPGLFDTGPNAGRGLESLPGLRVPSAGEYRVRVWLLDAAGNEDRSAIAEAKLRFDDIGPTAYLLQPEPDRPELIRVPMSDAHSGPAGGVVSYRREASGEWTDLPTETRGEGKTLALAAKFDSEEVPPGSYQIRARVRDEAGNETVVDRRGNGSLLTLDAPLKRQTRVEARLVGPKGPGLSVEVPFGGSARLRGRLVEHDGQGVPGQPVSVSQAPAAGSTLAASVVEARTGPDGSFGLLLEPGTSRRVSVTFAGSERFGRSSAGPLQMSVKGSLSFSARPARLRTGKRVRFRGRVKTGPARHPSRGSLVAIKYFERSSKTWRPVLVTRTGGHGRYSASYRFRYITKRARIRLRAVLLPSENFPYARAVSRAVKVVVRRRARRAVGGTGPAGKRPGRAPRRSEAEEADQHR